MDYPDFTAEVLHTAKAIEGANNSYASNASQWQATFQCLGWREAEAFRDAVEQFLPAHELGPRTLEVVRYVGSQIETNGAWPTRAVKLIAALAEDRIEYERKVASQPPARKGRTHAA